MVTISQGGTNTIIIEMNGTYQPFRTDRIRLEANGDCIQIITPRGTIFESQPRFDEVTSPSSTSAIDLINQIAAWL